MAAKEFSIIDRYFATTATARDDVVLGIGDDAALLNVPDGHQLVVTTDTLVSGVHFPEDTDPRAIGHKSLAVNLSDLAAMGAAPAWVTLALTLPNADDAWLTAFAEGFFALAAQHQVALVGGDTTHGPLSITVQAHGFVPAGAALCRGGAQPGDVVVVTGTLGDAALGLARRDSHPDLRERLDYPVPRVAAGQALRGLATSAIDISDGLLADLGHVAAASHCGATLRMAQLPLSPVFEAAMGDAGDGLIALAVSGGDDYELCFTISPGRLHELQQRARSWSLPVTVVGEMTPGSGVRCITADNEPYLPARAGFDHFA